MPVHSESSNSSFDQPTSSRPLNGLSSSCPKPGSVVLVSILSHRVNLVCHTEKQRVGPSLLQQRTLRARRAPRAAITFQHGVNVQSYIQHRIEDGTMNAGAMYNQEGQHYNREPAQPPKSSSLLLSRTRLIKKRTGLRTKGPRTSLLITDRLLFQMPNLSWVLFTPRKQTPLAMSGTAPALGPALTLEVISNPLRDRIDHCSYTNK